MAKLMYQFIYNKVPFIMIISNIYLNFKVISHAIFLKIIHFYLLFKNSKAQRSIKYVGVKVRK